MATASLHINKLSAAKRQIQAAIRMFFHPEDELAVHTVGAAAYELLRDIKNSRGMSEAADVHLASIFYVVRDFHRGALPLHIVNDPSAMGEVSRLVALLSPISADSKLSDVRAAISSKFEKEYWDIVHRVPNFLKHADRDGNATLAADAVNNQLLLLQCCNAYRDVAPDDLGNEGFMFQIFVTADNDAYQPDASSFGSLVASVRKLSHDRRVKLCSESIKELNVGA